MFVAPYVPNRIRTQPHYFIRQLARRGHRLTLATLWQTESERRDLEVLAGWGVRILTRRLEARLVRAFDRELVTSRTDRHALLSLFEAGNSPVPERIVVIPNGVDPADFPPGE